MVLPEEYDYAEPFKEGLACVSKHGVYGFVDRTGRYVIAPQFAQARGFQEGLAAVRTKDTHKWGFINKAGRFVIEPRYREARGFSDGLAAVMEEFRWGFIDVVGRVAVPLKYLSVGNFSYGLAAVDEEGEKGYVDTVGAYVIRPQFVSAGQFAADGLAYVEQRRTRGIIVLPNVAGYIDRQGRFVWRQDGP